MEEKRIFWQQEDLCCRLSRNCHFRLRPKTPCHSSWTTNCQKGSPPRGGEPKPEAKAERPAVDRRFSGNLTSDLPPAATKAVAQEQVQVAWAMLAFKLPAFGARPSADPVRPSPKQKKAEKAKSAQSGRHFTEPHAVGDASNDHEDGEAEDTQCASVDGGAFSAGGGGDGE